MPRTHFRPLAIRDIPMQERLAAASSEYLEHMPPINRLYIIELARELGTTPISVLGEAIALGLEILTFRAGKNV